MSAPSLWLFLFFFFGFFSKQKKCVIVCVWVCCSQAALFKRTRGRHKLSSMVFCGFSSLLFHMGLSGHIAVRYHWMISWLDAPRNQLLLSQEKGTAGTDGRSVRCSPCWLWLRLHYSHMVYHSPGMSQSPSGNLLLQFSIPSISSAKALPDIFLFLLVKGNKKCLNCI